MDLVQSLLKDVAVTALRVFATALAQYIVKRTKERIAPTNDRDDSDNMK